MRRSELSQVGGAVRSGLRLNFQIKYTKDRYYGLSSQRLLTRLPRGPVGRSCPILTHGRVDQSVDLHVPSKLGNGGSGQWAPCGEHLCNTATRALSSPLPPKPQKAPWPLPKTSSPGNLRQGAEI